MKDNPTSATAAGRTPPAGQPEGGLLLLDKPTGISSNQALSAAKRLLGIRKAGHAGTLDPFASGMLICAFGRATRVNAFMLEYDKSYRAGVQLGVATGTGDPDGEMTASAAVPTLDLPQWQALADRLCGTLEQVPPMYSAIKQQGKRLYELARQGIEVERKARQVQIHALNVTAVDGDHLLFEVCCSKGTYVRTLAQQLAQLAGTQAHLRSLRRTGIGPFREQDMVSPVQLADADDRHSLLLPTAAALQHLPPVELEQEQTQRFLHGQKLAGVSMPGSMASGATVRVCADGHLLGVASFDAELRLCPKRLL